MSFNLGWTANEQSDSALASSKAASKAAKSQVQPAQGHLKIKDLARQIDAVDRSHAQERQAVAQTEQMRQSYDLSVRNIDDNIYALAAATAALDRVEGKLAEARDQIERLCSRGEAVDLYKVERTLLALADHINQSVRRADENYINMLRDARLQIRISEVGADQERAKQVDLTLISLDKLINWKLKEGPADPQAWIELIDQMGKVAARNVQILSSLILTLFAARDYTGDVVELVVAPRLSQQRQAQRPAMSTEFVQSARAALRQGEGTQPPNKTPNRLMSFLKDVSFQA